MLPKPSMIANLAVTYRCNSRCTTCEIWKKQPDQRSELTVKEIMNFFIDNRDLLAGVKSIQVTGGEPFLRPDLLEILEAIHTNIPSCFIWIPTNGLRPERIREVALSALQSGVPLGVSVSVDGYGESHDSARGIEGAFESAARTLMELSKLKQAGLRGLTVGFTLTEENAEEAPKVMKLAYSLGADFSLRLAHNSGEYYGDIARGTQDVPEVRRALRLSGEDSVRRKGVLQSLTTLAFLDGSEASLRGVSRRGCSAGSGSFFLDPEGGVHPCLFMESIGSIRDASFREIWGSDAAEEARKRVQEGRCPSCWVECEAFRDLKSDYVRLAAAGARWGLRAFTRSA